MFASAVSAAFYAGLLLWSLHSSAVGAELAAPHNVTVETLNTNYTLRWDWDQSAAEGHAVTFTAQFVSKYQLRSKKKSPNWSTVCSNTSHRSCDLTELDLHYLAIYMLRVQANSNGRHSPWVQKEFCPDKDAAVGPPSRVALSPAGSVLDVFISDPVTSTNSSMKEKLPNLYYLIEYWEGSANTQASEAQMLSSSANLVTLPQLKAWTWYCVRVQSRSDFYNKSSSFTAPHCMQTEGAVQWWLVFLFFLGSLVICFILVLLALFFFFRIYKTVKTTFFPSNQLPPHIKQFLCDSPGSDVPHLLTPDSESELLCDKVTLCPEPVLEIHIAPPEALPAPPSGLEPDSSGRHSRQDSSGSGDSGVYSTEGNSGQRQLNSSGQSSSGAEASWQRPFHSEQVKMQDMFPGLKSQPLLADEGVVDMCV